jgi:hypothetical protein
MNERIRELAKEAAREMNETGTYSEPKFQEKFAELIVRECLKIVKSNTYGPNGEYDYSYSDESAAADERAETIYKDISYHFGVEE